MIVKMSPREIDTCFDLLTSQAKKYFAKGNKLEADYLQNLAKKFKEARL